MSERADSSATVILSPSRNSTSTTTASLEIPKGLKGLLDDITKEVLNLSPESHQLYKVCADYLERRLIERDPSSLLNTPVRRPPLRMISTYTTDSDSGLDVGATPIKGKFGSSKVRTHTSDWCQSSNRKGGTVPPIENIQERGLLLSTSDFEEDTTEGTTSFPTKKSSSYSESILEIEATFQETLLSRTELLLNESGKLSPLYPPNSNDKEDFTPSEELKEIRLETLRRAKLPISVHFTNEKALLNDFKSSQDLCPPLRLFINPEKPLLSTKDGCVQTSNSPPPVQDDVVARVLLEHAEEELDEIIRDPRRTVNYLDLSKLGEEGETPASDEIWLPLGDEDKFLSSDTDTFSIGTDKLSNIANMSGDELPTHSPMETENYSKFMGPIQEGLAVTSQNVLELSGKFKDLENTLRDLCQTVEEIKCTKTKQMDEIIHKMNEKCIRCSSNSAELKESTSSSGVKSKTITDTKQIADQLREDNSLLRQDLQRFRDRENKLFDRLEGLEHRLLRVNLNDSAQTSPPSDRSTFPLIQTELKKTKEFITNTVVADTEEIILPIDVNKSRRLSNDSRSSSAGNTRITAKLRPINDITLARSDNTILRQDIQICRERESQLLMRTIDLEDKIIKAASEDDTSNKKKKVKPEVNINIDFSVEQIKNGKNRQEAHQTVKVEIQDDKLPGKEHLSLGDIKSPVPEKHSETERQDPPLASSTESEPQIEKIKEIEAPKALLESKPSKFKESKVSKPSKSKNEEIISPSSSLTSKEEPKKSSKTTSHSKKEETSKLGKKDGKKISTTLPPSSTKESSSIAKSQKNSNSKSKSLESSNEVIEDQKPKKENVLPTTSSSKKPSPSTLLASKKPTSTQNKQPPEKERLVNNQTESNKVVKQSLYDGDDWKVTISSKHQLETIAQGPQTITISPKPPPSPPPPITPPPKVIKKDAKIEVIRKEPKEKKAVVKREKPPPPKTDPIPKPSMFPAARPPRGHIPIPPHRTVPKNPYQLFPVSPPPPPMTSEPFNSYEINNNLNSTSNNNSNPYDVLLKPRDTSTFETNSIIRSSPDGANSLAALELKNESSNESSKVKEEKVPGREQNKSSSSQGQEIDDNFTNELITFDSNNNKCKSKTLGHHKPRLLKRSLKSPFKKLDHGSANQRLRLSKRSKSTSQLNKPTPEVTRPKLIRAHHSVERLPTLSAFDEERVVWLKSFEDDITYAQERRKMQSLKELSPTDSSSPTSSSDGHTRSKSQNHVVVIDEVGKIESSNSSVGHKGDTIDDSATSSDNEYEEIKKSLKRKSKKEKKSHKPLVAECFIISRGWQMDQSRLIRALDRIKCVSFHRVQVATTVNRMVENLRPHQDVIVLHIGSQELLEASYGADDVSSVANSVSSVISKHIANVASQNRNTHFLVSLPIPRNTKDEDQITMRFHELRKAFNTSLSCSLLHSINVQCIDNENLAQQGSEGELEPKYYSDNVQLSSKGMRKLAKNWEEFLLRITKTKEGNIYVRRASDSSSGGSSNEPRKL